MTARASEGSSRPKSQNRVSSVPQAIEQVLTEGTFSVEKFIENFDVLVESAGSARLLRDAVLALAFTGKLVAAVKQDLPIAQVIAAIDKAWLSRKRKEELPAVESDEVPLSPSRWTWIRLGNLAEVVGGVTKGRDLKGRKRLALPYLRVANVQRGFLDLDEMKEIEIGEDELPKYKLKLGDVLFTEGGDWDKLGRSVVWRAQIEPCIHQNHVFRARMVHESLDSAWFSLFANSPLGRNYFETAAKRTTNLASINMTQLRNCPMPIPPAAEQKRIVARVDQLMALIDDLEQKQIRKRQLGANFTKASLEALTTAESPEDFDGAWKRVVENWGVVIDRAEKVAELRAAVLGLAVRGCLARSPGSSKSIDFLDAIAKRRSELATKFGCRLPETSPINDAIVPFHVPPSWHWTRLGDICYQITDGTHQTPQYVSTGIPFLSVKDVTGGRLSFSATRFISRQEHDLLGKRCHPQRDDILFTKVGTTGIAQVVDSDVEFSIFVSLALLKFPTDLILPDFLALVLNSPFVRQQSAENTQGIGNKNLVLRFIRDFLVIVPPTQDQRLVVAKVDHLMKLCDELEAKLHRSEDRASKLVEAVVQEMVG